MKHFLILISLILVNLLLKAQLYNPIDSIIVFKGIDTLNLGFSGATNAPQFSEIDLNQDGIKDLFVFDREGNTIKTFLNKGINGEVNYKYAPEYIDAFPKNMKSFVLLRDFNCDGKEDIFTFNVAGFRVFKNTTQVLDINPSFELEIDFLLRYQSTINVYCSPVDIPSITDLDNDGDLDILSFSTSGISVDYYKNNSQELYGNCDSLLYTKETSCWGQFNEGAVDNTIGLNFFCKGITDYSFEDQMEFIKSSVHSGSTLLAFDEDGDGDKELLLGDVSGSNVVGLTNGGSGTNALITEVDTAYPNSINYIDLNSFPAMYYLDVNNDNKKDLIVAPNGSNAVENFNCNWLYFDNSIDDTVRFDFQNKSFLQNEMLDFGSGAYPAFLDYNQDGLEDLIIGNYAYFQNGSYSGKFGLLENKGTANSPSFEFVTDDFMSISNDGINGVPCFGDLDGDGDKDMLIGISDGKLNYYENNAGMGNSANFVLNTAEYFSIDIGQNAAPFLYDLDGDFKLDIIIGERGGTINFFRNTGTTTNPAFNSDPDSDFFGEIDVMIPCCTGYSYPQIVKYDNDDIHLFVGAENGKIYEYSNIIGNLNGAFDLIDSIVTNQYRVSPTFFDVDNDGELEVVAGEYTGGIQYYDKPQGLTLLFPENNAMDVDINIFLDWTSRIGIENYEVQVDTSISFDSPLLITENLQYINSSSSNTDTELSLSNLLLSQKYYWRVRTITGSVPSEWTNVYSFTTSEAIENALYNTYFEDIKIYPNPTEKQLFIETNTPTNILIYNALGEKVFEEFIVKNSTINLLNTPSGVLYLTANNKVFKIIKY